MQFDLMSSIMGFLLGTATGAAGKYYADKYTDIRIRAESAKARKRQFLSIKEQMPELIAEFKNDLSTEANRLLREFFVLPDHHVYLGGSEKPRLVYYEDGHENLRCKIDLLETHGFLEDVTPSNTPIYKMTEEFVELVIKYG